jgi:hypothetical protein
MMMRPSLGRGTRPAAESGDCGSPSPSRPAFASNTCCPSQPGFAHCRNPLAVRLDDGRQGDVSEPRYTEARPAITVRGSAGRKDPLEHIREDGDPSVAFDRSRCRDARVRRIGAGKAIVDAT